MNCPAIVNNFDSPQSTLFNQSINKATVYQRLIKILILTSNEYDKYPWIGALHNLIFIGWFRLQTNGVPQTLFVNRKYTYTLLSIPEKGFFSINIKIKYITRLNIWLKELCTTMTKLLYTKIIIKPNSCCKSVNT